MTLYLFFKFLHIVSIISWMAGVLYLYRLFIYHKEWGHKNSVNHDMLCLMERRLMYFITHPAMGMSWIAGLVMISLNPLLMKQGWFHGKLTLVLFLTVVTVLAGRFHRKFKNKEVISFSSTQLRLLNEVPTVLMLAIVALVIFRP